MVKKKSILMGLVENERWSKVKGKRDGGDWS